MESAVLREHDANALKPADARGLATFAVHSSSCADAQQPAPDAEREPDALPVFDLDPYLRGEEAGELAAAMARCLRETGCLVVRDGRVDAADSARFLDLMERYFEQPDEVKLADARPQFHYQVGVTPEGIEVPRASLDPACAQLVPALPGNAPRLPTGPDAKWRFFWRVGPRPQRTQFAELNAPPVVPAGFPQWPAVLDGWGSKMLAALHTTAELVALGLGLPSDALTSLMAFGPHLLGPTGINLDAHREVGETFAGFHYDLNLLTIHGKSRFPGLFAWLRDGRRVPVRIPDGCLLLQAGKQLEWLTAGAVRAGMHEVVNSRATQAAAEAARAAGRSRWRVSSTVFGHVASDCELRPLGEFARLPSAAQYPPMQAGAFVEQELRAISLARQ